MSSQTALVQDVAKALRLLFPDGMRLDDDVALDSLRARLANVDKIVAPASNRALAAVAALAGVVIGDVVYPKKTPDPQEMLSLLLLKLKDKLETLHDHNEEDNEEE
ncbi:MAG: hypothetical protein IJL92_03445, partial [Thermoguttaceae bacterium]|nr:hypothetical protein [Thermoguttaceae bacterium]